MLAVAGVLAASNGEAVDITSGSLHLSLNGNGTYVFTLAGRAALIILAMMNSNTNHHNSSIQTRT
jgi:hypothetical protein